MSVDPNIIDLEFMSLGTDRWAYTEQWTTATTFEKMQSSWNGSKFEKSLLIFILNFNHRTKYFSKFHEERWKRFFVIAGEWTHRKSKTMQSVRSHWNLLKTVLMTRYPIKEELSSSILKNIRQKLYSDSSSWFFCNRNRTYVAYTNTSTL